MSAPPRMKRSSPWALAQKSVPVLEAILELPLGATMGDVARKVGRHIDTVAYHVYKLRKSGHVQVIRRGYHKRAIILPARLRLTPTEREWLKLGVQTARAILTVARAEGPVPSREVARRLGWHECVATYHLRRARREGILNATLGRGYTLAPERAPA